MNYLTIRPNGDNSVGWTTFGSGSYHYDRVNEVTEDDSNGVSCVIASAYGEIYSDYFNIQNHSAESGTISGVTIYAIYQTTYGTDYGTPTEINLYCNGYNTNIFDGRYSGSKKDTGIWAMSVNPATGVAWTWTNIDDIVCGIQGEPGLRDKGKAGVDYDIIYCYQFFAIVAYGAAVPTLFMMHG